MGKDEIAYNHINNNNEVSVKKIGLEINKNQYINLQCVLLNTLCIHLKLTLVSKLRNAHSTIKIN